jgi:hypothetical protein
MTKNQTDTLTAESFLDALEVILQHIESNSDIRGKKQVIKVVRVLMPKMLRGEPIITGNIKLPKRKRRGSIRWDKVWKNELNLPT